MFIHICTTTYLSIDKRYIYVLTTIKFPIPACEFYELSLCFYFIVICDFAFTIIIYKLVILTVKVLSAISINNMHLQITTIDYSQWYY